MAVLRDNPYGAFNFIVSLGGDQGSAARTRSSAASPTSAASATRSSSPSTATATRRSTTSARSRTRYKHRRRHAQARADRRRPTCSTGSRRSATGTIDARTVTITLLDEARNDGRARGCCCQRPAEEVVGPTLAAKGGGEVAMEELHLVPRGHRVQLMTAALGASRRLGGRRCARDPVAPPEPVRAITGVRLDVAAFAGVAPRGPARVPVARAGARHGRGGLAGRPRAPGRWRWR